MKTIVPKAKDLDRQWHLLDAKGQILGRFASQVAQILMGKTKTNYMRHVDGGDIVVVINCKEILTTGRKEKQKMYVRHSGFPKGFKSTPLEKLREEQPEKVIKHAVLGMLPQNKLRDRMMTRLFVFPGAEHTYKDRFQKIKEEDAKN
jgi:large subunit ribosomal protein L13